MSEAAERVGENSADTSVFKISALSDEHRLAWSELHYKADEREKNADEWGKKAAAGASAVSAIARELADRPEGLEAFAEVKTWSKEQLQAEVDAIREAATTPLTSYGPVVQSLISVGSRALAVFQAPTTNTGSQPNETPKKL
jgi:hypothetical protein